jgi:hypothetical protein
METTSEAELDAGVDRAVDPRQEAKRLDAWGYVLNSSKLFAKHSFSDPDEVKQALASMTSYDREEAIVRAMASLGDYIDWLEKRLDARIDEEAEKRRRDLDSPDSRG